MSRISNSFTIANAIVDLDLRRMSGNALKCYVVIVRKTTGWNKSSDRISIRQFQELAGIAKRDTVGKALRELEEMGLIIRHESYGKITTYSLNFDEPSPSSDDHTHPDKRGMTHPDERGDTHPDKRGTTKDTMTKDTSNKGSVCADAPPAPAEPDKPKPKRQSKADEFVAFVVARGVVEATARDWWQYRAGKPMTESAWQRHCTQRRRVSACRRRQRSQRARSGARFTPRVISASRWIWRWHAGSRRSPGARLTRPAARCRPLACRGCR